MSYIYVHDLPVIRPGVLTAPFDIPGVLPTSFTRLLMLVCPTTPQTMLSVKSKPKRMPLSPKLPIRGVKAKLKAFRRRSLYL